MLQVGIGLHRRQPDHVGRRLEMELAGQPSQHGRFSGWIGKRHVHDVHRHQLGLAGVEAALEDVDVGDGIGRQREPLCDGFQQGGLGMLCLR